MQPPFHGDVTAFVPKRSVGDFRRKQGEDCLAPARAPLDTEGLRYTKHIFVGHPASVIAQCGDAGQERLC